MDEVWKEVSEFPVYEISNIGRLRRWKGNKWHYLTPAKHKQGYVMYYMCINNKTIGRLAHRLVAIAFVDKPDDPSKKNVCHKDGDPSHNVWTNLRWDDQVGNLLDTRVHGTSLDGERGPNAKFSIEEVRWIREHYAANKYHGIVTDMAAKLNCSIGRVHNVITGKTWAHTK